jgi:hypothetical protein
MNIGLIHHGQGSYLQALDYFEKSLNLFQTLEDLSSTAAAYHNMAMTNESLGEFLKADEFLAESIRIRTELTDKLGLSSSYIQLGLNQLRQGKSEAAIQKCLKALKLSEEAMALTEQKESCNCLYLAYKQNGEQTLALQFHERMSVLDDSLQTDKTGRKLQQMEFQRQILMDSIKGAEERLKLELEYEKQVHRESSRRNIAILAGLFFLVSTIGLYSRVKYIRKSRSALQFEKERSEKLLLNILPAQIADELKERGEARAKNFAEVSILFTDFKDFTGKAANLSPEDLVEEINICFKVFDSICEKFGIEKIKTIGDA